MVRIVGTKNREETLGLIAKAWQTLGIGESMTITQPNDRGGKTLEKTIGKNFPTMTSDSFDKARHITLVKTDDTPSVIDEWITYTQLCLSPETGFYTMPGLFGWNKIDIGSKLLIETLPQLRGRGADFGCGYGYLSKTVLQAMPDIEILHALDIDARAVEACLKNCEGDERIAVKACDCTKPIADLPNDLDFIISNPPFHDGAGEDRSMGQKFIQTASHHLKKWGALWIVANVHMPYERILRDHFSEITEVQKQHGFKILHALK